jgi:EAL domain-containing protein (putative c-di-GMP-specific phosphodiesterase class I)
LLSHSDIALYEAKKKGRNRDEIFTEALAIGLAIERQTVYDLQAGLAHGQIVPFYQVQVDARTHEIKGLEALACWFHPSRGLLLPAAFLEIATNHGVVEDVDDAILRSALDDAEHWTRSGLRVPRVSVNLSAARLADPSLPEKLAKLEIPSGRVSFELIETIFLDSLGQQIRNNIDAIRCLGIDIEIDDLGSGHASMLGLLELRPDRVKIDRQLVAPILQPVTQRRLVRSLVDIARTLEIEVVAEGVETLEHADVLADLGVDLLQGYAFGRPETANFAMERLSQKARQRASA